MKTLILLTLLSTIGCARIEVVESVTGQYVKIEAKRASLAEITQEAEVWCSGKVEFVGLNQQIVGSTGSVSGFKFHQSYDQKSLTKRIYTFKCL